MTDTTDHRTRRAHDDQTGRLLNAQLKADGLSLTARRDRRVIAKEAAAETTQRRRAREMRAQADVYPGVPAEPQSRRQISARTV